jgi:DNA-binding transcriptional LysR family regulator
MNIETLRYIKAVADAGSISKAARCLNISQQGLNKSLTTLERELRCTLLKRTQHGVELTDSGQIFLSHAEELLREYHEMLFELNTFKHDIELLQGAEMRVVVSPACMHNIMTPMIEEFSLHRLKITEAVTEKALGQHCLEGTPALVDIFRPFYPQDSFCRDYTVLPLVNARYGIVTVKDAARYRPKAVSREYVSELPLGLFCNETTQAMYDHVFGGSVNGNVCLATTSRSTLFEDMLAGRLAILTDSFQWQQMPRRHKKWSDRVVFSEIEGSYDILFAFVYSKGCPPSPTQQDWMESFTKVFSSTII